MRLWPVAGAVPVEDPGKAGHFDERGSKIHEADEIIHHTPRCRDPAAPHQGQRYVIRQFTRNALRPRKRHSIIAGHHHEGIGEEPALFQFRQRSCRGDDRSDSASKA